MYDHEYNKPTVSGSGFNYSTLSNYNSNYLGRDRVMGSRKQAKKVIVPSYGGMGYDSLKGGKKRQYSGGYFGLSSAYPNYKNACGAFSSRTC